MTGSLLLDDAATVLALAALALTGWRLAGRLTAETLPRALAATAFLVALAVVEALALGLVGLSGTPAALAGLAVLTWLAAAGHPGFRAPQRPEPARAPAPAGARAVRGAAGLAAGGLLALVAIQLHRPTLGQDAITYHLPEVIAWVRSGHAGRVVSVFYGLPVANYPITQEVWLSWLTGLSHGFAAVLVATAAVPALALLAGWAALAELDVPAPQRLLALAAFAAVPLVVEAWTQPGTDLEAVAWLLVCAALCLAARRDPGLLAAALVAAGLAVGTKTTVVLYVLVLLLTAAWRERHRLAAHCRAIAAAALLAGLAGLTWYVRNWVDHGSPLWPFSSFPGGDPRPAIIDVLSTTLLSSLHSTLLDHLHAYASALSGGAVLLILGILCLLPGLALRRRRLALAGAVVLLGALEYAAGPLTGLPAHAGGALAGAVGSTLRYLMEVFAAGATALALLAADPDRRLRALGWIALAGALIWGVISDIEAHWFVVDALWLLPGAGLGAVAGLLAGRPLPRRNGDPAATPRTAPARAARPLRALAGLLAAGLLIGVLAAGSAHFAARHAAVTGDYAAGPVAFLTAQPGWAGTDVAVDTDPAGLAPLAGDHLQHPQALIPPRAACSTVLADQREAYLVVAAPERLPASLAHVITVGDAAGCLLGARRRPIYDNGAWLVFAPLRPGPGLS